MGRKKGELPFDYPDVETTAKKGDYLLCPNRLSLDGELESGADEIQLIYYSANMIEPGVIESNVKTSSGIENIIPNSLIIPIRPGETTKPGDILLTNWQSGSGMQRAIVVEGGSSTEPKVRYLDMAWDNPAGLAQREDILKPNSFHKLKGGLEVGGVIIVKKKSWMGSEFDYIRYIVLHISENKVLAKGHAGKIVVLNKEDCIPLPLIPKVKKGDRVHALWVGKMQEGTVEKLDAKLGRVFVKFDLTGEISGIAFGDLTTSLEE